jgi:type IV pilus assembly protein PilW
MKPTHNKGIGLIELMVGLAIGLGVILAATVAYQAQRQSWLLIQSMHALHHNANAAFDHLQTSAQSANAVVLQGTPNGTVAQLAIPSNEWGLVEGNARSDAFALSHFRVLDRYDCQGNHVGKQTLIRDSYQVNSKQELTCKDTQSAGATYQAIAEGVEDFQMLYAEHSQSQTSGGSVQWQWKNADQIVSTAQVVAIEICLRMVSTQLTNVPTVEMKGCQGESVLSDGKLRRVFRRVVAIRSHA